VKRSQPQPSVRCPYCGAFARLKDSIEVYGRSYGMIWDCRPCDAYVGVHKDSPTHYPLGRLANKELREWKMKAHAAFDPLWKSGKMTRSEAYKALGAKLRMSPARTHIGWFDVEQCQAVVAAAQELSEPHMETTQ